MHMLGFKNVTTYISDYILAKFSRGTGRGAPAPISPPPICVRQLYKHLGGTPELGTIHSHAARAGARARPAFSLETRLLGRSATKALYKN